MSSNLKERPNKAWLVHKMAEHWKPVLDQRAVIEIDGIGVEMTLADWLLLKHYLIMNSELDALARQVEEQFGAGMREIVEFIRAQRGTLN